MLLRAAVPAAMLMVLTASLWAQFDEPPVEFDAPALHPWTEIKPPSPTKDGDKADHKAVLIVIPISANFNIPEERVESIRYQIRVPDDADVIDFLPGTHLDTQIAGPVQVNKSGTVNTSVKVKYGAEAGVSGDVWGWKLNISGGGSKEVDDSQVNSTSVTYSYRPALQKVIVASTKENRKVLNYELKYFNLATRAGVQDFAILAVVPKDMTETVLTLHCSAKNADREVADMTQTVAIYQSGDNSARKRAKILIDKGTGSDAKADTITNSLGMKLVLIPSGEFKMGFERDDPEAFTKAGTNFQHRVKVSTFRMCVTEVTLAQFRRFVEETGYKTESELREAEATWSKTYYQQTDTHPVSEISWNDAIEFCNWLSRGEGRKEFYSINKRLRATDERRVTVTDWAGDGYRLPTEAEWEYACRAGTKTPFSCPPGELRRHAWFKEDENSPFRTHPVGQKLPNAFGLYDMHGSLGEWCWDVYHDYDIDDRLTTVTVDPHGRDDRSFDYRVWRGGSFFDPGKECGSSYRHANAMAKGSSIVGFRLVLGPTIAGRTK